jgi:hypothetical protein
MDPNPATEAPQKWGVHRLKIDRGILDEARMHKIQYTSIQYHI